MKAKNFASDKILQHLDRVQDWKKGKNPFPITVEIDATDVCNHKCPGCAGTMAPKRSASLPRKVMFDVIDQISVLGARGLIFTGGGEPLCNPHAFQAIMYASMKPLDIGLITNGSLLHTVDVKSLLGACTWIRISLDGGTAKMHRQVHKTGDFKVVVKNIKELVEAKKGAESTCTIGVGYLTGRGTDSYEDMMDFVELSVELGVDYAQFRPFLSTGRKDFTKFRPIDFRPFEKKATEKTAVLCSKHKYQCMEEGQVHMNYGKCYGHQFATVIDAKGNMTICCHTRGVPEFNLGNVKKMTVAEIWESDARKKAVEQIDLGKCPFLCRANTFNEILWKLKQERDHVNFL